MEVFKLFSAKKAGKALQNVDISNAPVKYETTACLVEYEYTSDQEQMMRDRARQVAVSAEWLSEPLQQLWHNRPNAKLIDWNPPAKKGDDKKAKTRRGRRKRKAFQVVPFAHRMQMATQFKFQQKRPQQQQRFARPSNAAVGSRFSPKKFQRK